MGFRPQNGRAPPPGPAHGRRSIGEAGCRSGPPERSAQRRIPERVVQKGVWNGRRPGSRSHRLAPRRPRRAGRARRPAGRSRTARRRWRSLSAAYSRPARPARDAAGLELPASSSRGIRGRRSTLPVSSARATARATHAACHGAAPWPEEPACSVPRPGVSMSTLSSYQIVVAAPETSAAAREISRRAATMVFMAQSSVRRRASVSRLQPRRRPWSRPAAAHPTGARDLRAAERGELGGSAPSIWRRRARA